MNKGRSILDYIIVIMLVIIVFFLMYVMFFKDAFKNRYQKMEDRMVSSAEEYVQNNNISVNKEIYFDVNKLGLTLDDDCRETSGVIYNGTTYQPYLACKEYETTVIPNNKEIKEYVELIGEEVIVITKGMSFYEPGYISKDIINKMGNVGTEEGVYTIYYKTTNSDKIAIRKVIIIDNSSVKSLFPTIKLKGDEITYVVINGNYVEPGVEATDTIDGNLSSSVKISGTVNTKTIDEYTISYQVTNSRGYTNYISRIVGVVPRESDLIVKSSISPENLTNQNVKIKLNLSDEYQKIIYPDGSEGRSLEYEVEENGKYRFIVFDKYGRDIVEEVEITNIDKTKPDGTCVAMIYYSKTDVKVTINSKNAISSYEYNLDGNLTTTQTDTLSSKIVNPTSVKVKVKDIVNNISEITCTIEKSPVPQIITNEKGKQCLEGYVCYVQMEWGSRQYPYCSMSDKPDGSNNSCNGINASGCSITSATNAIAAMGIKSKNGTLHTPWTVYDELYPVNKSTGRCGGGCSGWERIRDAIVETGLTAPERVDKFNKNNLYKVTDNLKQGYPVIIHANGRPYSSGNGHYMTLLAIRDDGYVFLSDSANDKGVGTKRDYPVDTWIPTDNLLTGNIDEFLLVGPPGLYKGKLR